MGTRGGLLWSAGAVGTSAGRAIGLGQWFQATVGVGMSGVAHGADAEVARGWGGTAETWVWGRDARGGGIGGLLNAATVSDETKARAAMAWSLIFLVANSLRLRRFKSAAA